MKLFSEIKNRFNIMIIILVIMMVGLMFRLSILTIVDGDKYREAADTKRIKNIYTTAPRGEIRDKNGVVLAASRRSFTVQILKDEIDNMRKKDKNYAKINNILLDLSRYLEEDGTFYKDEYPIRFNNFVYKSESDYNIETKEPVDKVVDLIVNNGLMGELLDTYYISNEYPEHYKYSIIDKAISAVRAKGFEVPINTNLTNDGLDIKFDFNEDIAKWKKDNGMHPDAEVKSTIVFLIGKDTSIIKRILDNSIARKLTYELLEKKGLTGNIVLEDIGFKNDDEYKNLKRELMKTHKSITFETTAAEDFVSLLLDSKAIDDLILYYSENDGKREKLPIDYLSDMVKEKELELPVEIIINDGDKENKGNVQLVNKDNKNKEDPLEVLKKFLIEKNLLMPFATNKDIKGLAQTLILDKGINPKISISEKELEYISIAEKNILIGKIKDSQKLKDANIKIDNDSNAEEVLKALINYYDINSSLSKYEIRSILNLYDQLEKQGFRAYEPINLAYDVKDSTVAKIEENFVDIPAVQISNEPIRYYPKGEHLSHIIGHLGKISSEAEIEKYVNDKNKDYTQNDIIGKLGLEESFEEILRGKNGSKQVEVDSKGNITSTFGKEIKSQPGNNIYLTIDTRLQEKSEEIVENALKKLQVGGVYESEFGNYGYSKAFPNANTAAAVAVNVKTGELISLVSYPQFNPNLFSTGISEADWESLQPENPKDHLAPRPLWNIATQTAVQPGSTFKMVTGLAAMEKGFSPYRQIYDRGFYKEGDTVFGCLIWNRYRQTHGYLNFMDALKVSCNYYFYSLAKGDNGVEININDIVDTATKLGLDSKTGLEINIPGEISGRVPTPEGNMRTNQALFKMFLDEYLDRSILEGKNISEEQREINIKEILSWLEKDEEMTKSEVINELYKLGYDGEMKLEGSSGDDLADRITFTHIKGAGWNITDTLNVTIGQGQSAFTPLQMANAVATMVNGGNLNKIGVVDSVVSYDGKELISKREMESTETGFNKDNLDAIKEGMRRVTSEFQGTALSAFKGFPISTGAKTGTAELESINPVTGVGYDDYSWFVAFGPYEDPEIAVAVLIFQGGGGSNSAPIARDIMGEYFKLNGILETEDEENTDGFIQE